jgi:hypothetical protein
MIVTGPENIPFNTKFRLIKGPFKTGFTVLVRSFRFLIKEMQNHIITAECEDPFLYVFHQP